MEQDKTKFRSLLNTLETEGKGRILRVSLGYCDPSYGSTEGKEGVIVGAWDSGGIGFLSAYSKVSLSNRTYFANYAHEEVGAITSSVAVLLTHPTLRDIEYTAYAHNWTTQSEYDYDICGETKLVFPTQPIIALWDRFSWEVPTSYRNFCPIHTGSKYLKGWLDVLADNWLLAETTGADLTKVGWTLWADPKTGRTAFTPSIKTPQELFNAAKTKSNRVVLQLNTKTTPNTYSAFTNEAGMDVGEGINVSP